MSVLEIGCCGAYCKTCPEFRDSRCKGCKIGYGDGARDIRKARCRIKVCCITRGLNTCADCGDYSSCAVIRGFYNKKGYKYGKYRQATRFIREKGYPEFLEKADAWKNQYGKYE